MKRKNKSSISQARTAYGMITPAMLIIMGLGLFPVLFTLWFSLNDVNPGSLATKFVGLKNYAEVMSTHAFWNSLKITLYFSVVSVIIQIILGTLTALLLNQNFKRLCAWNYSDSMGSANDCKCKFVEMDF